MQRQSLCRNVCGGVTFLDDGRFHRSVDSHGIKVVESRTCNRSRIDSLCGMTGRSPHRVEPKAPNPTIYASADDQSSRPRMHGSPLCLGYNGY